MTDTAYDTISTTDLMARWDVTDSLVVYMDRPHQIRAINQDGNNVAVVTNLDTFLIPRSDKHIKMWTVLG